MSEWGTYLSRGVAQTGASEPLPSNDVKDINVVDHEQATRLVMQRIEAALQSLGLTKFSASVAAQYFKSKLLDEGGSEKFKHVLPYMLSLINPKKNASHPVPSADTAGDRGARGSGSAGASIASTRTSSADDETQAGCPNIIPGLRAMPFWDTAEFPWIKKLESMHGAIKQEFISLRTQSGSTSSTDTGEARGTRSNEDDETGNNDYSSAGKNRHLSGFQHYRSPIGPKEAHYAASLSSSAAAATATNSPASNSKQPPVAGSDKLGALATFHGDWNVFYFYLHGLDFKENLSKCPITSQAIQDVPRHYSHAFLSALAPDTHIIPHFGPTNKKLRCHLPIVIPGSTSSISSLSSSTSSTTTAAAVVNSHSHGWLKVAGKTVTLTDGKCVVFDDSFKHEAGNSSTTEPRIVLIVDFWHPDLSDEEVRFLEFINKAQVKAAMRISKLASNSSKLSSSSGIGIGLVAAAAPHVDHDDLDSSSFFSIIMEAKRQGIACSDENSIWGAAS